jgi:exosortase/archaeosortase family protein
MLRPLSKYLEPLKPYSDVIIFMVTLLVANYAWKWTMVGDENGDCVTWFGLDITAPFEFMACHIASVVYWLVSLFRDNAYMSDPHTIRFVGGTGTTIIWGCTGLKQSFIWLCLILTVKGTTATSGKALWLKKLWFIPLGWVCCYAFNILRIFLIALLIEQHPNWFPLLHDYIFKYLFYGMLFGLWVWFVEGIRGVDASPSSEQSAA